MVPDSKNLPMSSFHSYVNGADPGDFRESYNVMRGLVKDGSTLPSGTRYSWPGDPIAGTGDLELAMGNRHCLGSWGPISFNPGDSQFVMFKVGVGNSVSNIQSLVAVKANLNGVDSTVTEVPVEGQLGLPLTFTVDQNYPNPFNPSTTIKYELPTRSKVQIDIYNALGQHVARLTDSEKPAGAHTAYWQGRDANGNSVGSGVYLYRVKVNESAVTRKMMLLK